MLRAWPINCTRTRTGEPAINRASEGSEEAEQSDAVKFSIAGGTCLHALAANIQCGEDIMDVVAGAAPESAALVDDRK